mgnify:CR=1 FL=1
MQSSTIIYQLLSQSTMFPSRSTLHEVVANCYGNGLKALKGILQCSHLAFVDEPTTVVTNYPKQKELSLLEHKMEFEDCLQMRSIVMGFSKELDDPGELDVFIMNMQHRDHVQCITQDERHQLVLQCKHRGDHLLETLNSVLMNSDSPARNETRASRPVRALTTPT